MRTVGNIRIEQVNKAQPSVRAWYRRVCESTSQDEGPPNPQIKWFIFEDFASGYMEMSRDCKDFLASFDLGTSCRLVDVMIFLPGICLFPFDLLCFAGSGLWRSGSIFGMLQLGSVGDSQLGGAGGVKDGGWMDVGFGTVQRKQRNWVYFHPKVPNGAKLRLCAYNLSLWIQESSYSRIQGLMIFVASQLPGWKPGTSAQRAENPSSFAGGGTVCKECWWRKRREVLDDGNWKKVAERKKHEMVWQKLVRKWLKYKFMRYLPMKLVKITRYLLAVWPMSIALKQIGYFDCYQLFFRNRLFSE